MTAQDQINTHTISVLVDNEAGVLARESREEASSGGVVGAMGSAGGGA